MRVNCSSLSSSIGSGLLLFFVSCGAFGAPQEPNQQVLEQQIARNPGDFQANHRLGELYVQHGDFRAARRYLEVAYKTDPANYANAFDLAQAELQSGDATAARALVQTLLARNDRPELRVLLGDCDEALGDFREAANQYQIAARADPSEPNLFSFGSELLKHGAYPQAVQIFSYAAGKYPQSPRIRVAFGIAQYSTGDYSNAVATLCSAVDLNPKDPRAFEFLGRMAGVAPELNVEVSARLKQFAAAYPNNAAANYYYALNLLAQPNAPGDVIKHLLERAVSEAPSFAEAHYQLGVLLDQQKNAKGAISELETATRLKPDWKAAHYRLAQLYRKTGQTQRAEREYEAVRSEPER